MKYDFLNKEALFREGSELFLVRVFEHTEDDWGIVLRLKVLDNKIAYDFDEDIEYRAWTRSWDEFCISGEWSIACYDRGIFSLAYVGSKLNFRQPVIDAFRRDEKDWCELWMAK